MTGDMLVPTNELRAELEKALGQHFGQPCRITALERSPSAYRSSFALDNLVVRLDDSRTLTLVFKNISPDALWDDARHAKPAFLYDPRREAAIYRTVLGAHSSGTATCYGAIIDEQARRYWLFLEKVAGQELYTVGEFATWEQVARWLAAWHTRMAGQAAEVARTTFLVCYDRAFYEQWMERALAFMRSDSARSGRDIRQLEWLAQRYGPVVDRLAALPTTVLHGEFYASNIMVQETAGGLRICPIDWEMAALGPGWIDLAALTSGSWSTAQKESLIAAYYSELHPESPTVPEGFRAALDFCRLHIAIQWLGWSPAWSPPSAHAHDWLSEAVRLAEQIKL